MTKKYVSLVLTALIIGAVGVWLLWFSENRTAPSAGESAPSSVSQAALASYTNSRGQKWNIQKGEYDFSVASAETYPRFVIGFINPLDVKVGDTQKMMIAINGDKPVSRVWAEVETDTGIHIVDLKLDATSTVSYSDLIKQKYIVDQEGNLVFNKGGSEWKRVVESLVSKASAADPVLQYTYIGEWKVSDTHTKTYHTKFVAEDSSGRSDTMILAWSDPVCDFDGSGLLIKSCSATNTVEGPDKSIDLSGNSITLGSGGILAFPPGGSISLGTGTLTIGTGGIIQKKYLCMADNDGDGFIGDVALIPSDFTSCTGYQKRESNVYYAYGRQIKNGGAAAGENIAFLEKDPIKRTFSLIEQFIQQAFAVGPCPGNPNCPGPTQQTWTNPGNAAGASDGVVANISAPIGNPDTSQHLHVYNYGFTFPTTATSTAQATNIKITVRARVSGGSVNMAVFEGTTPSEQIGTSQTVSATSLTDYVFQSRPVSTIQASTMNLSSFGSFIQAYDGLNGPTVYIDSAIMEISYKMTPVLDGNDSFTSTYGSGDGLYNNVHTEAQCTSAGGTACSATNQNCTSASGVPVCRFGSSIPGGWTAYGNWSQTSAYFCPGFAGNDLPTFASIPRAYAACDTSGCTTGSHLWANTARESCTYQNDPVACTVITCDADYTYQAAY